MFLSSVFLVARSELAGECLCFREVYGNMNHTGPWIKSCFKPIALLKGPFKWKLKMKQKNSFVKNRKTIWDSQRSDSSSQTFMGLSAQKKRAEDRCWFFSYRLLRMQWAGVIVSKNPAAVPLSRKIIFCCVIWVKLPTPFLRVGSWWQVLPQCSLPSQWHFALFKSERPVSILLNSRFPKNGIISKGFKISLVTWREWRLAK